MFFLYNMFCENIINPLDLLYFERKSPHQNKNLLDFYFDEGCFFYIHFIIIFFNYVIK